MKKKGKKNVNGLMLQSKEKKKTKPGIRHRNSYIPN